MKASGIFQKSNVNDERPGDWISGVPRLSSQEFACFQKLIYEQAGIALSDIKRPLVAGRLSKRLRALGLTSFSAYLDRVGDDDVERVHMLDCITTNETHFFRDQRHFRFLSQEFFPQIQAEAERGDRRRSLRIWSAACSTGEEPFSLAMSAISHLQDDWSVELLGTDLSTAVLDRCRAALYPIEKSAEIPKDYLKRFMLRGTGANAQWMKAGPELRKAVRFERMNLFATEYPVQGTWDLIFCCNVLIYFDLDSKRHVIEQLANRLAPGGYLFFGHAESLSGITERLSCVQPTIYRRLD